MMKQIQQFATSAAITIGMHMYGKYTTPMAIACLQPIFMAADPLFQIHLLGRPAVDKLKRPFPDMATECASCSSLAFYSSLAVLLGVHSCAGAEPRVDTCPIPSLCAAFSCFLWLGLVSMEWQ